MCLVGADALISDSIPEKNTIMKKIIAQKKQPPDIHKMFTEKPLKHLHNRPTKQFDTKLKAVKRSKTFHILHHHENAEKRKHFHDYTPL